MVRFWLLRPFSLARAYVATLRTRDCFCCVAVLRVAFCTGATSHSARTIARVLANTTTQQQLQHPTPNTSTQQQQQQHTNNNTLTTTH